MSQPPDPRDARTTDDDDRLGDGEGDRADAPVMRGKAAAVARQPMTWRTWVRIIGAALAAILIGFGWLFIATANRFHITVPMVVMSMGWAAVILAAYLLIRIGVAAAFEERDQTVWWRPIGKRDELEREKRSLLKAIKEIEFDREMGKMTDADAAEIVRVYRAHAIEIIKAIDHLDSGGPRDVREEIEREVRARLAVASKPAKRRKDAKESAKEAAKTKDAGVARDAGKPRAPANASSKTAEAAASPASDDAAKESAP